MAPSIAASAGNYPRNSEDRFPVRNNSRFQDVLALRQKKQHVFRKSVPHKVEEPIKLTELSTLRWSQLRMGEASIDELFDGMEGIFECIQVRKRDILGSIWSPRPASWSNVLFACLRCSGLYEFTNRSRAINSGPAGNESK